MSLTWACRSTTPSAMPTLAKWTVLLGSLKHKVAHLMRCCPVLVSWRLLCVPLVVSCPISYLLMYLVVCVLKPSHLSW